MFYFRVLVSYNKGKGELEIWGWLEGVPTQRGRSSISVGEKNLCILFADSSLSFGEKMISAKRRKDLSMREVEGREYNRLKAMPCLWHWKMYGGFG